MRTLTYFVRVTVEDATDRSDEEVAESVAAGLAHSTAREALEEATRTESVSFEMLPDR